MANLPEDKLSKIVDCLEVVSYSVKLSVFLPEDQLDFYTGLPQRCSTLWQLMGGPALQIAAVKTPVPFGGIPLPHVSIFAVAAVGESFTKLPR